MSCPRCGYEITGDFCSNCGHQAGDLPPSPPHSHSQAQTYKQSPSYPQNTQTPHQPQHQQYSSPNRYPIWYKDGSIVSLFLIALSVLLILGSSLLFGLLCSSISLIVAIQAKKRRGRVPILAIILSAIVLVVEILGGLFVVFLAALFMNF